MRRSILVISLGNERNHLGKEQDSKKNDKIQLFLFFIRVFENSSPSLTRESPSLSLCFTFIFLSLSLSSCASPFLNSQSASIFIPSPLHSPPSLFYFYVIFFVICYILLLMADACYLLMGE